MESAKMMQFSSDKFGMKLNTLYASVALAIGTLVSLNASAQTTPTTPAKAEEKKIEEGKLESITVTAQRREQELQAVPLPVSTFTARDLETKGITTTRAIADFIPNMVGQNNTGLGTANVYFIRGLGNTESIATFDPPVGTYVNDVYVSRQNANNFGFFDVERIEVLRGPQGTLFGRNTTGGAINVILKKPGNELGGYLEGGFGTFGQTSSRGSVDIPMADNFKTKFSYFYNEDNGFVNNIANGQKLNAAKSTGARGAFLWNITSGLVWDLAIDQTEDEGTNVFNALINGERIANTGYRTDQQGFFNAAGQPLTVGEKNGYGLGNRTKNNSITSNVGLTLGSVSIDFITGWRDMTQKFGIDFLQNPLPGGGFVITNDARNKQLTQEIKASGQAMGDKLSYVVGGFYMKETNTTDFADLFRAGPGFLVLGDRIMKNDTKSTAFYAQVDYKLTSQLTATVGARNTADDKTISFTDNRPLASTPNLATRLTDANILAAGNTLSQNTRYTTPRFALAYQVDPNLMLFGSATRGYKAGGWSSRATSAAAMQPFLPETIWSYEGGWRASLFNNAVRFNTTLFSMDVSKLQTVSGVTLSNGSVSFIQKNFADLKNRGAEIEISTAPIAGFSAYLNLGFQDAKYENLAREVINQQATCRTQIATLPVVSQRTNCNQGIITANGDISIPTRVPKKTINPGATYSVPLGVHSWRLATTVNAAYTSKMAAATNNAIFAGGHTVINASIALLNGKNDWRITLDCTNCGDKSWVTAQLANQNYLNEPRRYSIKGIYNFR
jgi:iron complex outermembrane recepter protein